MSYRQKVDLCFELYPKRKPKFNTKADLKIIKKALYAAEEFRNRIVHSFWALECGDNERWVRIKGSLKGRNGFSMKTVTANSEELKKCSESLVYICQWMYGTNEGLLAAIETLNKFSLEQE